MKIEKSYSQFKISQKLSSHASKREESANSAPTKVKTELEKLLNEGHIEILTNCSDQFVIR